MKWNLLIIFLCLIGCQSDQKKIINHYFASIDNKTALLEINETENRFYGTYEVKYGHHGKDSGTVRGERIGDTLKGRFVYLSYGGNKKVTPFVLLKCDNKFKLGSGIAATYLNIPFFLPKTLQFKDEDFQFIRIEKTEAEKIKHNWN